MPMHGRLMPHPGPRHGIIGGPYRPDREPSPTGTVKKGPPAFKSKALAHASEKAKEKAKGVPFTGEEPGKKLRAPGKIGKRL